MTQAWDPLRLAAELQWLQEHPEFEERPASIKEFVGPAYLNIEKRMRVAVMAELAEIIGHKVSAERLTAYSKAMFTGAIGIGKTTIASVVLPYLAHYVLCLKDPQGFFDLLPGSRIAFMQMSTSGKQAKEVVFGDIKARIDHSPWFQNNYPPDPKFTTQIRFTAKDVWILPGDSEETTFEGYNILGGILDEADSHQVTENKDYAEQGYTTISSRVSSRFQNRGFVLVIGQMKKANGFAAKKFKEFSKDPDCYAVRMTIWESFGWDKYLAPDGTRDSFWYDTERNEIVTEDLARMVKSENLLEIPNTYKQEFLNNPTKALRDLAGIPPATGSPFIALTYKITECTKRWHEKHGPKGPIEKVSEYLPVIEPWFQAPDRVQRVAHIDMAYSAKGDGLGLAMGHVSSVEMMDGEQKPYITFDLLCRIHAPEGREIFLGDIRRLVYSLRDDRKFVLKHVTMDGFQSVDTRQQLERRKIFTEVVSVDKTTAPYEDLREAIYENRVDFPRYMVRLYPDDTELTEIAVKELMELVDNGKKIDHPEGGSKDLADAMAGVVYTLMGDRSYHRRQMGVPLTSNPSQDPTQPQGHQRVGPLDSGALRAPIPPSMPVTGESLWRPPRRS